MRRLLILFMGIFLFVGCEKDAVTVQADKAYLEITTEKDYNDLYLSLYYEDDYTLQKYEPENGVYLGAYVLESESASYDMTTFDEMTKKEHSSYIYSMRVSEDIPYTWLLTCIKEGKTPHIVIHPDDSYMMYDTEKMKDLSIRLGEVYVPMFVELYPNPKLHNATPSKYIEFYRKSRLYFNENAPNAAFIFSTDVQNVNSFLYYPGDDYVDWVGAIMAYPYYSNDSVNTRDVIEEFERVYYMYHNKKPIMITGFMVSHFATLDHGYKTSFALEKIDMVYNVLTERYPRLKGIYYIDYNATKASIPLKNAENYSVLDDLDILECYKAAISKDTFLTDIAGGYDNVTETFKSPYDCLSRDGVIHILEKSIRNDFLKDIDSSHIKGRILVDGEYYYPYDSFYEITGYNLYYYKNSNIVMARRNS